MGVGVLWKEGKGTREILGYGGYDYGGVPKFGICQVFQNKYYEIIF